MSLVPAFRKEVLTLDRNLPLIDVKTMEERIGDASSRARFSALSLSAFAGVALVLSALGIYGVMSWAVAHHTHEIGVRMAVGAARGDVLRLVVGKALLTALAGVAVGIVAAWGLMRLLTTMLYQVSPYDAGTFSGIALVLAVVASLASYVPARRAMRVDPVVALRSE